MMLMSHGTLFMWCVILILIKVTLQQARSVSSHTCIVDTECGLNGYCFQDTNGRYCKCLDGFMMWDNKSNFLCVPYITGIDSKCIVDEQCEVTLGIDSQCGAKNTCECLPNAHYILEENSCYRTKHINETCSSHHNCRLPNGDALYCTNGKCTCGLNEYLVNEKCIAANPIGAPCTTDENCMHNQNAVCRQKCTCRVGYVISNDQMHCLPIANYLNENCTQLSQCTFMISNSICSEYGECVCDNNFHPYGRNRCFQNRKFGGYCDDDRECITTEELDGIVKCKDNICTCTPGRDPYKDCSVTDSSNQLKPALEILAAILLFIVIT